MKVLHVSTEDARGGAGVAAFRLHQALRKRGVDSSMLVWRKGSDDPDVEEVPRNAGYRLTTLASRLESRCIRTFCGSSPLRYGGVVPGYTARLIREMEPDIVNLHLVNRGMISIGQIARLELPVVWTLHDMWAITSGYSFYESKLLPEFACSQSEFDPDVDSNKLTRWLLNKKSKAWKNHDFEIVCPSKWLQSMSKRSPTVAGKKIHRIPNGVDLTVFQPGDKSEARSALGLPQDKKMILFGAASSGGDKRKGGDLLLDAIRVGIECSLISADDTELVSFGHQPDLPSVMNMMNVHRLGSVASVEAMAQVYAAADVFVAPSREDNLPNTVLEAMACGVPIVAFRMGGMPDMIDHLSTGYLAEPFDTHSLAEGIAYALSDVSPADVRRRAERDFALERQAAEYTALYENVLGVS